MKKESYHDYGAYQILTRILVTALQALLPASAFPRVHTGVHSRQNIYRARFFVSFSLRVQGEPTVLAIVFYS